MSVIMEDKGRGRIKVERLRESERVERMNDDMSFRFHTKRLFYSILFYSIPVPLSSHNFFELGLLICWFILT